MEAFYGNIADLKTLQFCHLRLDLFWRVVLDIHINLQCLESKHEQNEQNVYAVREQPKAGLGMPRNAFHLIKNSKLYQVFIDDFVAGLNSEGYENQSICSDHLTAVYFDGVNYKCES